MQVNKVCGGLKVDFAMVGVHYFVFFVGGDVDIVMRAPFLFTYSYSNPPNSQWPALKKRLFAALGFVFPAVFSDGLFGTRDSLTSAGQVRIQRRLAVT